MTDEAMSPLRRRMIEDMTIRKFAPKTHMTTCKGVKNFAAPRSCRSPATASLARIGNSGRYGHGLGRSTHRYSTAMTCSTTAAASVNVRD